MANTTTVSGSNIQIVPDGATDWVWSADLDTGLVQAGAIKVRSIQIIPSATKDRNILQDGGIDAAPIFDTGALADVYDTRVYYVDPPVWMKPVLDASDWTFGTAGNVRINIGIS